MKTTTILLCITTFIYTSIKSMEMDIEEPKNQKPTNKKSQSKPKNSDSLETLLKQNNILLHTLILQNQAHIEYKDSMKNDSSKSKNQHAKDGLASFTKIYKAHNAQLDDKTLHIPIPGQTTMPNPQNKNKNQNTENII